MKTILITGATSGIGFETAKAFFQEYRGDVQVISVSRSKEKIESAKKQLPNVDYYSGDISNFSEIEKIAKQIETKYDKIDVLINNAGTIISGGLESLKVQDWDFVMQNNLTPYFYVSKVFLPLLKKSSFPSIINISSVSGKMGGTSVGYGVVKAGVDRFTRIIANELAKYRIRVNTVSPGMIGTGFHIHNGLMNEKQYREFLKNCEPDYPLGLGQETDIAGIIVFLASEKAKWITGADFAVDGGRLIKV